MEAIVRRPIDQIIDKSIKLIEKSDELRKFLVVADYTMGFAPDRTQGMKYFNIDAKWKSFFNEGAKIEKLLEQEFWDNLYVHREQLSEIEGYFPGQRLILIHGLPGTGKTVVARRIQEDFKERSDLEYVYFDIKANIKLPEYGTQIEFAAYFVRRVYDFLKRKFIDRNELLLRKWFLYKIQHDNEYTEFREFVYDLVQKPLEDEEEWRDALEMPIVREKFFQIEAHPSLTTLISFLQTQRPVVICFDNVDRLPLYDQRQIFEICIDLSNFVEASIVLAIRDSNLRRVTDVGAMGDTMFVEKLDRLKSGYVSFDSAIKKREDQQIHGLTDAALSDLLQRRLDFLARHGAYQWLYSASKLLLDKNVPEIENYMQRFQRVFKDISMTFVDNDMYRFCNYNIRSLLIMYSNFVNELLISPEPGYSVQVLLPKDKFPDITHLRNYFYKWLIFRDLPFSSVERESGSVLRMGLSKNFSIAYKVLAYLYNLKGEESRVGIRLLKILEAFNDLGYKSDEVKRTITKLSQDQNYNDNTSIWLEAPVGSATDDKIRVFLMPSGRYFLEKLSVSREFAFWNILLTEFTEEQFSTLFQGEALLYEQTLDDSFKLETIYRFAKNQLFTEVSLEVAEIQKNLKVPEYWRGTNLEYYKSAFVVRDNLYINALLTSVQTTIRHTDLPEDSKKEYNAKYQDLIQECTALFRE